MGLLTKALKTAVKAADAAKDASRTKPKSQMNPLVKARKKPIETDFEKSASQEVKDFLSAVEEKDPNQLGEFYSPVVSTLEEMPIGKQGTKGENISAFIQKRAPSITGSEKGNLPKLDPKKKYTREEAIETLKPIDKSYSIEINQNPAYQNPNQRGNQRQNITDKEESYFEVFVKQKDIDPEIEEVSGGHFQDAGILAHTRSSIRRETPVGGPLTKKIKDRERYLLIEEMQSDVANLVEKNVDELGMSRISEDAREVFAEEGPQGNFANEVVDNLGTPFNKKHENILNDWYTKIRKRTDLGYVIGENYSKIQDVIDLKRIYKDVLNIDVGGRTPEQIHKNASVRLYENDVDPDELIMNFGDSEYDIGEYFDETFNYYLKLSTDVSKKERKFGEITYPKSAVPLNTRTEYVTKLIQANIALAKKQGVTKIVIPDYKEIARLRDHIQTDGNKEDIFKMTYEDAVNKALKSLIKESKGQIKVGKRELKYNSAEARGNRKSTATEIDISDFDFNPDTQAFRFNKGGIVPMNNQTQQAFALGGLKDEGGEIDEESGNRVPIGGTKEGVRDDIPANVSEGEFIFPADVVRYHGLDKMMALRQEAKMGLKQMERMGQMGNSEEATMPDDLPFEMADLIVVGGQGEPMEFANGGFVPSYAPGGLTTSSGTVDLDIADVPMMGDSSTGVGYTPINYDDYMKPPVVIMKEYRNANGDSIIITYVNGIASTEIPAGYTLYTPPANTAPTTTQAAIQTANNYSYQTFGGDDSDTPRELQVDPDYASMDNDTYFSTMERQNSFSGKAGNAAAMGIAMAMGPFGLLTMGMLQADKRRQLAAAEQRIAAETDPTKKKAYQATFAKMGGKTKEPEEENALVKFGKGFVAAVSGLFGLGNNDVEKVASVAGSAAADNTNAPAVEQAPSEQSVTPTADQTRPQLRPDQFPTVQETISKYPKGNVVPDQIASPLSNVLSAEANQGMVPAPASTSVAARSPTDFQYDAQNKALISGRIADQNFTNDRNAFVKANDQARQIEQNAEQMRADAARERSLTMPGGSDQSVSRSKIKAGKRVGAAPRYDEDIPYVTQPAPAIERPVTQTDALLGAQTDAGRRIANARGDSFIGGDFQTASLVDTAIPTAAAQTPVPDVVPESPDATRRYGPDELSYIDDNTYRDTKRSGTRADYNLQQPQTLVEQGQQAAYNARRANERAQAEIQPFISSPFTDVAATDDSMGLPTGPLPDDPRDIYSRGNAPTNIQKEGVTYGAPDRLSDSELSLGRARNVATMPDPYTEIFDTPAFDSSTKPTETTQALGEPFAAEKTKRYDAFGDEIKEVSTDIKDFATPIDAPSSKVEAKKSTAARTSKGTSTRKAAPTGDDRRSDPNFLERAFGITPAKISARRGNDGILYRTQADKREADKRQEDAKVSARNQGRAAARASGGQAAVDKFNKENADDIEKRHGGNKENSNNKIVCSAMNNAYGFGSFRNKIWLEHSKNNLTKEHQVGYHRMFLPLIHLGYNKDYKFIRKCLEHIARHRTADIYFQSKSNKRDTLGMVYRTILEPICYLVGMFPTSKDNK